MAGRSLAPLLSLLLLVGAESASAAPALPLGPRSLDERRATAELAPGVRWTRIARAGGPWRLNVLTLAPGVRATVAPAGGSDRPRARPSSLARRLAGVAAVNGGYFSADGNAAGVLASGGSLISEPVNGRSALVLGAAPGVTPVRFEGTATVGARTRLLDGVNRYPGVVPACGGRGGDRPTQRPDATRTCIDPSELVAFTPAWGRRTPSVGKPRVEAVVRAGRVTVVRAPGANAIPPDGYVLAGTGDAARFLRRAAAPGAVAVLDPELRGGRGPLAADALAGITGGGPSLLARGRVRVRAAAEGFDPASAPLFHGSFVSARHPRTLAGVRPDGTLLLVTVDGRRPGWSAGLTLGEAARVMRSLGARHALNLDGGGSTSMTVRGRLVNRPSDPAGERPVSDALVVLG